MLSLSGGFSSLADLKEKLILEYNWISLPYESGDYMMLRFLQMCSLALCKQLHFNVGTTLFDYTVNKRSIGRKSIIQESGWKLHCKSTIYNTITILSIHTVIWHNYFERLIYSIISSLAFSSSFSSSLCIIITWKHIIKCSCTEVEMKTKNLVKSHLKWIFLIGFYTWRSV